MGTPTTIGLLYVGTVLVINGLCMLGWISNKGAAPLNYMVGAIQVLYPTVLILTGNPDTYTIALSAVLYIFGFC